MKITSTAKVKPAYFFILLFSILSANSFSSSPNIELGTAIRLSNIKKITQLLESGTSPDTYGYIKKRNFPYENIQKTQLYLAVESKNFDIVKLLMDYNVNLTQKSFVMINNSGTKLVSPLQLTAKINQYKIAKTLLENHVSPNLFFNHYASSLTIASHYKHFDMVKLLLHYKANPDTHGEVSKHGGWIRRSPLLTAIENKDLKTASYLLGEGIADICYTTTNFKLYAYRFARKSNNQKMINLVRSYRAEDCIW